MPLLETPLRHAVFSRRIIMFGLLFFALYCSLMLTLTWHDRELQHQQLLESSSLTLQKDLNSHQRLLSPLLPFTQTPCDSIGQELSSRAAIAGDLRTLLLVNNDHAYCSSTTGAFDLPVSDISAQVDTTQDSDIQLIKGTSFQPGKPALVMWLKTPGSAQSGVLTMMDLTLAPFQLMMANHPEITGIALENHGNAMTSWESQLTPLNRLPVAPLHRLAVAGYPLEFTLYGSHLAARDYQLTALGGIPLTLMVMLIAWLALYYVCDPGKQILLAIKRGEFHVEYQPLIASASGSAYGVEALLRWHHPRQGMIPPDIFIRVAEKQNVIIALTRHLFQLVARDAKMLCQHLPAGTHLGLNLSPLHLEDDSFRQDVLKWVATMPENHFNYVFEITEHIMVREKNAEAIFSWLRQNDIRIAIDDFGTGHSALIYLEKYPFDYLKIDRGFIQPLSSDTLTSPVLDTVLQLAHKLKLKTVAEGVETREQEAWLINRGVSHLQGYLYSRPLKPEGLISWFEQHAALKIAS